MSFRNVLSSPANDCLHCSGRHDKVNKGERGRQMDSTHNLLLSCWYLFICSQLIYFLFIMIHLIMNDMKASFEQKGFIRTTCFVVWIPSLETGILRMSPTIGFSSFAVSTCEVDYGSLVSFPWGKDSISVHWHMAINPRAPFPVSSDLR